MKIIIVMIIIQIIMMKNNQLKKWMKKIKIKVKRTKIFRKEFRRNRKYTVEIRPHLKTMIRQRKQIILS
jgi:hypothetical protein